MKRLLSSFSAKIVACILSAVCAAALILSSLGIVFMYGYGVYTNTYDALRDNLLLPHVYELCDRVAESFQHNDPEFREYLHSDTNILYTVTTWDGTELENTYQADANYIFKYEGKYGLSLEDEKPGKIQVFVRDTYFDSNKSASAQLSRLNFVWSVRYTAIAVVCISAVAWLILFIFLLCAAGKHKDPEKKRRNMPLDLCFVCLVALFVPAAFQFYYSTWSLGELIFSSAVALTVYFLSLWFLMQFVAQLRAGTFLRSLLIARFLRAIRYVCRHIRLVPKVVACCCALFMVACILTVLSYGRAFLFSVLVLFYFAIACFVVFIAVLLRKLQRGGEKIADGDLTYQCDTQYMFGECKRFADTLNQIGGGVQKAVDEQMKSERFRAELITNVSHDIKTPLTSIINYVDLLKKEQKPEYIEVLDRQSLRLKKLTEDLVEASKASSGSLPVNAERLDLGMLLEQTVGEFRGRLQAQELEVVLHKPEQPVYIFADGRLLWRVFENLLGNICKYAQPGTRVYLDLAQSNGKASVLFRNISKYPLNISGEELTERFVRGDRSRHTEGSGLGLSIAKNLVELQNGKFRLMIDGDLFKALVAFDVN